MIRIGLVTFVLQLLAAGCMIMSEHSNQNSVKVSFVAPNQKAVLHEPVFLKLIIKNDLGNSISFDLGHNRKSNLEFTITKPDGTIIQLPRASEEGFGRIGTLKLPAGESYSQRILLNEWYEFPEVGLYKIKASLVTPITSESGSSLDIERSAILDFEVLPANPEVLSSICRNLANSASDNSNASRASDASLALSYVRDPIAVPFLKELLDKGGPVARSNAAVGLGRIGNRDAIEKLLTTLSTPDADLNVVVRRTLRNVSTTIDDPELRNRIKAALRPGG